jgi:hypothetical protein
LALDVVAGGPRERPVLQADHAARPGRSAT